MIKIYHNPRCSKSREGLQMLEEEGRPFEVVKYLEDTFTREELKTLIEKLGIEPIELVRQKEQVWKENYKDKELSGDELISILAENPQLIERPIVVNGDKAVIARPAESIRTIL